MGVFPTLPCPIPLFLDIIHINHLRYQFEAGSHTSPSQSNHPSAATILEHVNSFSPQAWTQNTISCSTRTTELLLMARIFQSSVALYAISSLQSSLSSANLDVDALRQYHRTHLFNNLCRAQRSSAMKKSIAWPLVVAGVNAAEGSQEERLFVEQQLTDMSHETGASYPLVARDCLHKFWESGKTGWDECFDQPCAILI